MTVGGDSMAGQLGKVFPGDEAGFDKFPAGGKKRHDVMLPCLRKRCSGFLTVLRPALLRALPYLSLNRSLFGVLGDYFRDEKARLSFAFQSKHPGMSPWECSAAFGIPPYIEYAFGVYHVTGGLSEISETIAVLPEAGAGVPAIVESGRISGEMILKSRGILVNDGRQGRAASRPRMSGGGKRSMRAAAMLFEARRVK